MLNICYNAIDRHIENGKGDKIAIIYDSPVTNTKATITYKEVLEQVISHIFYICYSEIIQKLNNILCHCITCSSLDLLKLWYFSFDAHWKSDVFTHLKCFYPLNYILQY